MTRDDFIAAWGGASANARFTAFLAWIAAETAGFADLLPPLTISRNTGVASVAQVGQATYAVQTTLFQGNDPDPAAAAGDYLLFLIAGEYEAAWYANQIEIQQANEDKKKYLDKLWEKLLKDAKPKGSKAGLGNYLYVKLMKELEYGSG